MTQDEDRIADLKAQVEDLEEQLSASAQEYRNLQMEQNVLSNQFDELQEKFNYLSATGAVGPRRKLCRWEIERHHPPPASTQ